MKRLFVLSVILALMLGCATLNINPAGKLTTLPYESELDPNIFYNYDQIGEPQYVMVREEMAVAYFLAGDGLEMVVVIMSLEGELLSYGWESKGEVFVYELNKEKTKYIKYVEEDKSEGI